MPTISTASISRVVSRYAAANGYAVLIQLTGREETSSCVAGFTCGSAG